MDPQQKSTAEQFDRYHTVYSDAVNASLLIPGMDLDYFTRVKAGHLLDITQQELGRSNDLAVLDVGCGIGNYHAIIKHSMKALEGCDISHESIQFARAKHPDVAYKTYDGLHLPYDDGAFDLAFTICVMHHVPPTAREAFCGEMRRVLRSGGLGLVFEHNPYNPLTRIVVNRCPFDADAVLLRSSETRTLFKDAGFRHVRARSILNFPSVGRMSRWIDRTVGLLPTGAQYYLSARA